MFTLGHVNISDKILQHMKDVNQPSYHYLLIATSHRKSKAHYVTYFIYDESY